MTSAMVFTVPCCRENLTKKATIDDNKVATPNLTNAWIHVRSDVMSTLND